jgi:hypothetical protein
MEVVFINPTVVRIDLHSIPHLLTSIPNDSSQRQKSKSQRLHRIPIGSYVNSKLNTKKQTQTVSTPTDPSTIKTKTDQATIIALTSLLSSLTTHAQTSSRLSLWLHKEPNAASTQPQPLNLPKLSTFQPLNLTTFQPLNLYIHVPPHPSVASSNQPPYYPILPY